MERMARISTGSFATVATALSHRGSHLEGGVGDLREFHSPVRCIHPTEELPYESFEAAFRIRPGGWKIDARQAALCHWDHRRGVVFVLYCLDRRLSSRSLDR